MQAILFECRTFGNSNYILKNIKLIILLVILLKGWNKTQGLIILFTPLAYITDLI